MKKFIFTSVVAVALTASQFSHAFSAIQKGRDIVQQCRYVDTNLQRTFAQFDSLQTPSKSEFNEAMGTMADTSMCMGFFLGAIGTYESAFLEGHAFPYSVAELITLKEGEQNAILDQKMKYEGGRSPSKNDRTGFCQQPGKSTIVEIIRTVSDHIAKDEYLQRIDAGRALITAMKAKLSCNK